MGKMVNAFSPPSKPALLQAFIGPQYKLTCYTVYDKEGHVVPFDTGIIDKNKYIYFSGYLKHLTCEDPSIEDGVPVFDCGPINAWSNAGFDGGEKALTIFS